MVSTPSPLIFWNQRGLGSKVLSLKELQGKSWKQMGCGWMRAFLVDEIYICYRLYLIVKSRELRGKSGKLCRNGKKNWQFLQCGRSLKVRRPHLCKTRKGGPAACLYLFADKLLPELVGKFERLHCIRVGFKGLLSRLRKWRGSLTRRNGNFSVI